MASIGIPPEYRKYVKHRGRWARQQKAMKGIVDWLSERYSAELSSGGHRFTADFKGLCEFFEGRYESSSDGKYQSCKIEVYPRVYRAEVPPETGVLSLVYDGNDGTLLVSYRDFVVKEDLGSFDIGTSPRFDCRFLGGSASLNSKDGFFQECVSEKGSFRIKGISFVNDAWPGRRFADIGIGEYDHGDDGVIWFHPPNQGMT